MIALVKCTYLTFLLLILGNFHCYGKNDAIHDMCMYIYTPNRTIVFYSHTCFGQQPDMTNFELNILCIDLRNEVGTWHMHGTCMIKLINKITNYVGNNI